MKMDESSSSLVTKEFRLQITAHEPDQDGFMIWTDATVDTYIFVVAVVSFCLENGKIQQSTYVCSNEAD